MYKLIIAITLVLAFSVNAQAQTILEADEWLDCGDSLYSPNDSFRLVSSSYFGIPEETWYTFMLLEGNDIKWAAAIDAEYGGYGNHYDQWAHPNNNNSCYLIMQSDGNLVFYGDSSYQAVWASDTDGNDDAYLNIQNDGNLVIYDADDYPIWSLF